MMKTTDADRPLVMITGSSGLIGSRLVSAVISLILVYTAFDEVYSSLKYLYRVWKKSRDYGVLWAALWGRPTPIADEAAVEMVRKVA